MGYVATVARIGSYSIAFASVACSPVAPGSGVGCTDGPVGSQGRGGFSGEKLGAVTGRKWRLGG